MVDVIGVDLSVVKMLAIKYNKATSITPTIINKFCGFEVMLIKSYIHKNHVDSFMESVINDPVAKAYIVGSAWPNNDGWEVVFRPETIFAALNGSVGAFKLFKISPDFTLVQLDMDNPLELIKDDEYIELNVTYSDLSCLDIMSTMNNETKFN